MPSGLYTMSIANERFLINQNAASKARQISKEDLISHDLTKLVDRLCPTPIMHFARLKVEERRGKRDRNMITVNIPFDGDEKSLLLRPSRCTMPNVSVQVYNTSITFSLPDDDRLDDNVNSVIELINRNIESLRQEWLTINTGAKTNTLETLNLWRRQVEAERARDAKRSFPID